MLHNIRNHADFKVNSVFSSELEAGVRSELLLVGERNRVAAIEEVDDVGLRVPVFVAVARVAEGAVVAETFEVLIFDARSDINDLLS